MSESLVHRERNFWKILADTQSRELEEANAEIERLTRESDEALRYAREFQTDPKRVGDRIDEQDAEIERLKAELLFVAAESEKLDEEVERLKAELVSQRQRLVQDLVEARKAARQLYSGHGTEWQRMEWLKEMEGEG